MSINVLSTLGSVAKNTAYTVAGIGAAASILGAVELVRRAAAEVTPDCVTQKPRQWAKSFDQATGQYISRFAGKVDDYTGIGKARSLSRPFAQTQTPYLTKATVAAFILSTALFEGLNRFAGTPSPFFRHITIFQFRDGSLVKCWYQKVAGLAR